MEISDDFKVACEIYRVDDLMKQKAYFYRIVEDLKEVMDENVVKNSLETLCDWGIIVQHFVEKTHTTTRCFYSIEENQKNRIKDLYQSISV